MPKLILDDYSLDRRAAQFHKFLNPLLRENSVPFFKMPKFNKIYLVAGKKLAEDYRDYRFLTKSKNIRALYFEEWSPIDIKKQDKWLLTKSYLTLYLNEKTDHDEIEFLCLHSDPTDPSPYKQVFHLHIKAADHPIPKSHISLGLVYINDIFKTIEEYNKNLTSGIKMICDEVLSRL